MDTTHKNPGTGANSGGTTIWQTPTQIAVDDNVNATMVASPTATTNAFLRATNFAFGIPANAEVNGIELKVAKAATGGTAGQITDDTVQLVLNGAVQGSNLASATAWPSTKAVTTYGGPTNLWGTTLTAAQVNNTAFGVQLRAKGSASTSAGTSDTAPTTVAQDTSNSVYAAWTSPANVLTNNGAFATATLSGSTKFITAPLEIGGFGFNVPAAATILGLEVKINRRRTGGAAGELAAQVSFFCGSYQSADAPTYVSATKSDSTWPTTAATSTLGGAGDLWTDEDFTTAPTPAVVNASDFKIFMYASDPGGNFSNNRTANIDWVTVGIYYSSPASDRTASVDQITAKVYYTEATTGISSALFWAFP